MIQDATGKFSSRCVLPDRKSLAVVMDETAIRFEGRYDKRCPPLRSCERIAGLHIGEDPAKTNAIHLGEATRPGRRPPRIGGTAAVNHCMDRSTVRPGRHASV